MNDGSRRSRTVNLAAKGRAARAAGSATLNGKSLQLWTGYCNPLDLHRTLAASERRLRQALQQVEIVAEDNTRLRAEIQRLLLETSSAKHRADHDQLTGLANRRLLIDRSTQALALAQRHRKQVGFMVLDLNGFKQINDRLGHDAGDEVLRHVAECLRSCTRSTDTVCRYGGDEFVIMLPELDGRERIATLAAKIHRRLADRYAVEGAPLTIATAIGVAVYPADGESFRMLMKQADMSMYWAKTARH